MKKLFYSIQGLFTYLLVVSPAFAQSSVDPCESPSNPIAQTLCNLGLEPAQTIQNIIVLFVVLAVVIALLYLLYGGVKWITSRGDKTEVEAARNHIIAAIVGLIVVFLSIFILSFVLNAFGLSFGDLEIPEIYPTP